MGAIAPQIFTFLAQCAVDVSGWRRAIARSAISSLSQSNHNG